MDQILGLARGQGFTIEFLPLHGYDGLLLPGKLILVDYSITERRQRYAVAHEMGHAWHGHDHGVSHEDEALERQADLYAVKLLISPAEYALAEALHSHPGAIAKELGVSQYLIELWQSRLAA